MKKLFIAVLLISLMIIGCGVNKDYVAQQIQDSEARTKSEINTLSDKTDGNATEITKLRSLSNELSDKADMAINKAKGFENYQIIWQGEINYDFDSYEINATAEQILIEAGEQLEQKSGSLIEIAGHTDRTGAAKYNLMLGQQRSDAAKRFLSERFGISLYRMFIISFGESKPVALADENQASSRNRRVSLVIWGEL